MIRIIVIIVGKIYNCFKQPIPNSKYIYRNATYTQPIFTLTHLYWLVLVFGLVWCVVIGYFCVIAYHFLHFIC